MNLHDKILEYLDHFLSPALFLEISQLKTATTLNLIGKIIRETNKTIPEAVGMFMAVIRYLHKDFYTLQEFIEKNTDIIYKLALEKKNQANLPSRGLPLLEIIGQRIDTSSLLLIELGASFGLIGHCLLNPCRIINNKNIFFHSQQQIPDFNSQNTIDYYLGIESNLPDRDWILAWEWFPHQKKNLNNFIQSFTDDERFRLVQENAFGFSKLRIVEELSLKYKDVVILTSFILHQYEKRKQQQLKEEIIEFINKRGGHWLNQDVSRSMDKCYLQLNGEKILDFSDDSCRNWTYLPIH